MGGTGLEPVTPSLSSISGGHDLPPTSPLFPAQSAFPQRPTASLRGRSSERLCVYCASATRPEVTWPEQPEHDRHRRGSGRGRPPPCSRGGRSRSSMVLHAPASLLFMCGLRALPPPYSGGRGLTSDSAHTDPQDGQPAAETGMSPDAGRRCPPQTLRMLANHCPPDEEAHRLQGVLARRAALVAEEELRLRRGALASLPPTERRAVVAVAHRVAARTAALLAGEACRDERLRRAIVGDR
jgi:hypothetical protein